MNHNVNKLSIFVLILLFVPLLFLGLFDLDEGAFASTSLQMIKENQFVIPMIGDELRLEKPILTYWIQAASIMFWGANEFALRLPSVIASFFWAFSFSKFVKRHDKNSSSAEIFLNLLTLPGVFIISFAATADAFLNLFITLLMIEIYEYAKNQKDIHLIKAAFFVALGFLVKGLTIIAIGGMVALIFFLYQRKFMLFLKIIFNTKAWVTFLIVVAPWFLLLANQIGYDQLSYLFFDQTFGRFTSAFEKHDGPIYYYLIILIFLIAPYLIDTLKGISRLDLRNNELEAFLFIWFIFVLLFFSFSSTKLPHYILYGITPIAFFIFKNHDLIKKQNFNIASLSFHVFIWLLVLAIPFYLSYLTEVKESYEVSTIAITEFKQDLLYQTISLLMIVFLVIGLFVKLNFLLVKRISSIALIAVLSFKILPFINESTQSDIKKLGMYAAELGGDVTTYKLNKPSFGFYANKISYRGLERADIILTRMDKIDSIDVEFEIISTSGNYLLIKKKNDN